MIYIAWLQMLILSVYVGSQIRCSEAIDFEVKTARHEDGKSFLKVAWSWVLGSMGELLCLSC